MLPKTMRINNKNHLEFGGCDLVEIAEKYGTPLYVMDESMIRENCRSYLQALKSHYQGKGEIAYAAKAFLTLAMARLVQEEGLGMDVVSGGELFCALKAGFDPSRLFFHGNNKSKEELISGLKAGVGRFVVDSFSELDALSVLAQEMKTTARILLRVKPGIEAHTHEYIKTGQEDSKFGFGLERDGVLAAVKKALTMKGIALKGLHCHIGSQILDPTPFAPTAAIMMELLQRIREVFGIVLEDLDLGGGMGIRYEKEDEPVPIKEFVALVSQAVQQEAKKYNYPLPRLILEPGRSIVGEAGITLYRVGVIKNIPGIRKYVSVDGGMMDNIRPALYRAKYSAVLANRAREEATEVVTIAGKACESGDILIKDIALPPLKEGDLLAVLSTGGYNHAMASNYNLNPRPPVVFLKEGDDNLVVRRETYEDLIRRDIMP